MAINSEAKSFHSWCSDPACRDCKIRRVYIARRGRDPYEKQQAEYNRANDKNDQERFLAQMGLTWKPSNRSRPAYYAPNSDAMEHKGPLLFDERFQDIELFLRDCPWRYMQYTSTATVMRGEAWGRSKGLPIYDCLHTGFIAELPLERITAKNAVLLDWVTFPKMAEAIEAVEFRRNRNGNPIWNYKAAPFIWIKTTPQAKRNMEKVFKFIQEGNCSLDDLYEWIMGLSAFTDVPGFWHKGNGFWTMANSEVCLLYTKGTPTGFRIDKSVSQLIVEPVTNHSAKPRGIYEKIDRVFGTDRKRCELFARATNPPPPGWLASGLEFDGLDICKALGMDARFWHENQPKFEVTENG